MMRIYCRVVVVVVGIMYDEVLKLIEKIANWTAKRIIGVL